MDDYSREAVLDFLDYLGSKGLLNKNTASSRKVSVAAMLSVLDESEAEDLRNLDIETLTSRFANIHAKKYSPSSLRVYKSRLSATLQNFFRYKENPSVFRISSSAKPAKKASASRPVTALEPSTDQILPAATRRTDTASLTTINVPVSLRGSYVVTIQGIPLDMTASEARRIANVVIALASSDSA